jgi:hypothetical protein
MKLKVPRIDLRGGLAGGKIDVVDEETGKTVGFLHPYRARHISLFAGKYSADLGSHEQCAASLRAVLNAPKPPVTNPTSPDKNPTRILNC